MSSNVQSAKHTRLEGVYTAAFTTVTDYSAFIKIEFDKTRADRLNGTVSYDVKLTNIGQDNIQGPLVITAGSRPLFRRCSTVKVNKDRVSRMNCVTG